MSTISLPRIKLMKCSSKIITSSIFFFSFFFQAEDGIRDVAVTGVQTCALPISLHVVRKEHPEGVLPPRLGRQQHPAGGGGHSRLVLVLGAGHGAAGQPREQEQESTGHGDLRRRPAPAAAGPRASASDRGPPAGRTARCWSPRDGSREGHWRDAQIYRVMRGPARRHASSALSGRKT